MDNEKAYGVVGDRVDNKYGPTTYWRKRSDSAYRWAAAVLCIFMILGTTTIHKKKPWLEEIEIPDYTFNAEQGDTEFIWSKLEPSPKLEYVPCYGKFYCARLEVQLDWNSTDPNGKKAVLAVIKYPAQVDVTHPSYGGAIFFNPGGPGGSGVQFLRYANDEFSEVLNSKRDDSDAEAQGNATRFYDLMSWDPRGVGHTTPTIEGFSDPAVRAEHDQRFFDLAGGLDHPEFASRYYSMRGIYGKQLSSPQPNTPDEEHPARFIGTTSVIRDMVELIEKHGEWREQAAEKIITLKQRQPISLSDAEVAAIRQRTKHAEGKEKLQFWGFSYGTIVGQTFATMYPERVGRLAIDGVVNATDYYAGQWKTALIDVDKVTANFTMECELAGPEVCPFARLTAGTDEKLLDGLDRAISSIRKTPITGLVDSNPVYISDFPLTMSMHTFWYSSFDNYPTAGKFLWAAATRNVSYFAVRGPPPACDNSSEAWIDAGTPQTAVACTDAPSKANETANYFYEYTKYLREQSPYFGNSLSRVMSPCHSLSIRPKWRFDGPFGAQTANPILVVSQTLDPITPLTSAQGAASLFPGSQVIEAQGLGHCSLGWPSLCAMKHVREYFRTGKVPQEYTKCPASFKPFTSANNVSAMADGLSVDDRYLMASMVRMAKNHPVKHLAGFDKDQLLTVDDGDDHVDAWWNIRRQETISVAMEQLVRAQY